MHRESAAEPNHVMTDPTAEPLLDPGDSRRRNPYLGWVLWVTLLLLLVAGGLLFSVPIYRQQALIREIEASGLTVETEFTGPDWLQGLVPDAIGGDSLTGFERIVTVFHLRARFPFYGGLGMPSSAKPVTDATLKRLGGLRSLRILHLDQSQISDAGLEHLKGLTKLRVLVLSDGPRITDAGLEHLKGLTKLQKLVLAVCPQISDAGLEHLKGMTKLQVLWLLSCPKISEKGVAELKKALPKCEITHY